MVTSFDSLSGDSRVWIYQADRPLSNKDKEEIQSSLTAFCNDWQAHGKELKTSYTIAYDRFVILAAEESFNQVSGCSIDSSVHFIRQLGANLNLDFLNRSKVPLLINDVVEAFDFNDLKAQIVAGRIPDDARVFNMQVVSKQQLEGDWILPVKKSWLKKYFDKASAEQ